MGAEAPRRIRELEAINAQVVRHRDDIARRLDRLIVEIENECRGRPSKQRLRHAVAVSLRDEPEVETCAHGLLLSRCAECGVVALAARLDLDEYEIANLREGLHFLRAVGGDTGDWLGQLLNKLPEVEQKPNRSAHEQRRDLATRIGWRALWPS